ncbi:MAG TPA: matrixin family metalloprotease, partial [Chroococcales cyanobacterium]
EEKERYQNLIQVSEDQVKAEQQAAAAARARGGNQNYYKNATASGVWRWPQDRIPISYYVYPGDKVRGYKPEYDEILRKSFNEWADASDERVDFIRVYRPEEAHLTVTWTDDLHAPNLVAEAGHTTWESDEQGIKNAAIKLLTVSPFKGELMTDYLMHNICLHEIGHALGIGGHSNVQDDIMYPACFLQTGISQADRNTLALLYEGKAKGAD